MSFPPSAACKFLDLHPVNLRNLHLHLTKNPFASRPPHLCGVTLKNLRNKPSSMGVSAPKGSRGRSESPLVASAEAKIPCIMKRLLIFLAKIDFPIILVMIAASRGLSDRPLDSFGGRPPCCLSCIERLFSYWQGRFAACAFVGDVCILVARVRVGALPQTPQGTLSLDPARGRRKGTKSPLDPFSRLSWSRFHAPSACSFLALRLSPCLLPTFP